MALVYWLVGVALVAAPLLYAIGKQLRKALMTKKAEDHPSENYFVGVNGSQEAFPDVHGAASVLVTVVVPAYNEEKRITPMMEEMLAYLTKRAAADAKFTWEVLVVDDGSKDKTAQFVQDTYVKKYGTDHFRLLKLFRNNGKGGAVRKGMVRARGQYVLMADADGATRASDLGNLLQALQKIERGNPDGLGIAVGSRAHLDKEEGVKASRTTLRRFLMWGFHTLIKIMIGGTDIEDTQCGFKLFTRAAAARLFPVQHIDRWAFDVELIYLAARHRIPLVEVPVEWKEIDGTKLDVVSDTLQMARDIVIIRLCYSLGLWEAEAKGASFGATGGTEELVSPAVDAGSGATSNGPRKRVTAGARKS